MVHTGGGRRRGKSRSRILYWFRTPPGVRVGRAALDEEAIRLIEEHNPDVEFDWTRILKGQGQEPAATAAAPFQERRTRERPGREGAAAASAAREEPPDPPVVETAPATVSEARLGPEGLARLRARHAALLARISEGVTDPGRRDELKVQAERLNPDTWVTEEEVAAGLESYEATFESLRTAVGHRRKRRRSRKPRPPQDVQAAQPGDAGDGDNETPEADGT